jgi:hypothetical protein
MATMVASNTTMNCATHNNPSAGHRRSFVFLPKPLIVVTRILIVRSGVNR